MSFRPILLLLITAFLIFFTKVNVAYAGCEDGGSGYVYCDAPHGPICSVGSDWAFHIDACNAGEYAMKTDCVNCPSAEARLCACGSGGGGPSCPGSCDNSTCGTNGNANCGDFGSNLNQCLGLDPTWQSSCTWNGSNCTGRYCYDEYPGHGPNNCAYLNGEQSGLCQAIGCKFTPYFNNCDLNSTCTNGTCLDPCGNTTSCPLPARTCSVSLNNQAAGASYTAGVGTPVDLKVTGRGDTSGSVGVGLYLNKPPLAHFPISPVPSGFTETYFASLWGIPTYYQYNSSSSCTSTSGSLCSNTVTVSNLPAGSYNVFCDVATPDTGKCSGNPVCDYYYGSGGYPCSTQDTWKACTPTDHALLTIGSAPPACTFNTPPTNPSPISVSIGGTVSVCARGTITPPGTPVASSTWAISSGYSNLVSMPGSVTGSACNTITGLTAGITAIDITVNLSPSGTCTKTLIPVTVLPPAWWQVVGGDVTGSVVKSQIPAVVAACQRYINLGN